MRDVKTSSLVPEFSMPPASRARGLVRGAFTEVLAGLRCAVKSSAWCMKRRRDHRQIDDTIIVILSGRRVIAG
jgi:hypothetical protein